MKYVSTITSLDFRINSAWDGGGIRQARADIDSLKATLASISNKNVRVAVDTADAKAKVDSLRSTIDSLGNKSVRVAVDTTEAKAKVDDLKRTLDGIGNKAVRIMVDDGPARAQIDRLKAEIQSISNKRVRVDVDTAAARAQLDALRVRLDETARTRHARIDVDTSSARSGVQALTRDLGNSDRAARSSASGGTFWGKVWRAALISLPSLINPIAPALLGVGAAALSMGGVAAAGFGVFGAALAGNVKQVLSYSAGIGKLQNNMVKQKTILSQLTPGTKAYGKEQKKVNEAIDRYNHAMASATPMQKVFLDSVLKLKEAWAGFLAATQTDSLHIATNLVSGLADAVKQLLPIFQKISPLFVNLSQVVQNWLRSTTGGFSTYANLIKNNILPITANLITFGKNIAATFGIAFKTLIPLGQSFARALAMGSAELKKWAQGGGFTRFLDRVRQDGPQVKAFFSALWGAFKKVSAALGPLGPLGLGFATSLLRIVAAMPPGVIQAIALGFLAVKSAMAGVAAINAIGKMVGDIKKAAGLVKSFALLIKGIATSEKLAAIWEGIWAGAQWALNAATGVFALLLDSLGIGELLMLIGLIIAAIIALIFGIKALVQHWSAVWGAMKKAAEAVWKALVIAWKGFIKGIEIAWDTLTTKKTWVTVWHGMQIAAKAVWDFLKKAWHDTIHGFDVVWQTMTTAKTWKTVWDGMKMVATTIWNALKIAWHAVVSGFTTAWNTVSGALRTAWSAFWNVLKTAAEAIWNFIKAAWTTFINGLRTAFSAFATAMTTTWNTLWNGMKTAGQAIWNFLKSAWDAVSNAMRATMSTLNSAMTTTWNTLWNGLKAAGQAIWNFLKSAWDTCSNGLRATMSTLNSAMTTTWNTLWNGIKAFGTTIWNFLKSAWQTCSDALRAVMNTLNAAMTKTWNTMWNTFKSVASAFSKWLMNDFWNPVKNFFTKTMPAAFSAAVKDVGAAWNSIKKAVGEPIYIVVNTLYTNGIKKLWDGVSGIFGGPKLPAAPHIPHYAVGGPVNGPGTGTSDSITARLSAGEHVITAAEVQGAGGHQAVAAQRKAWGSKSGQTTTRVMDDGSHRFALGGGFDPIGTIKHALSSVGGVAKAAFSEAVGFGADVLKGLEHLALGGVAKVVNPLIQKAANVAKSAVKKIIPGTPGIELTIAGGAAPVQRASGPTPGQVDVSKQGALGGPAGAIQMLADTIKNWITQHDIAPTTGGDTAAAQKWADAQVGKPYSLGSFGSAFDCSSFMSGIASIILGKKPAPLFTTFAFTGAAKGPATFEKNLKAPFMVGVENRGIGHMAGTLNGKNYEATPPKVRSGPSARGATNPMFDMVYGMKASSGGGTIPTGNRLAIIDAALKAAGVPPPGTKDQWERGLNTLITRESNWNSGAVNKTDSNAAAGHASQGLAQVVPGTFAAYHVPGTPLNILDPVANVAAAIRYIVSRYGNISAVQQANANLPPKGYASGTNSATAGVHLVGEQGPEMVMFDGGEKVLTAAQTSSIAKNFVNSGTSITNEWKKDWTENHQVLSKNLDMILKESDKFNTTLKKNFSDNGTEVNTKWKSSWDTATKDAQTDFTAMTTATTNMWTAQKKSFTDGQNYLTNTFFPPVNDLMTNKLPASFATSVTNIGTGWLGLEKTTHDPVAAVVDVVYNKGIVAVWNQIAKAFGAPNLATFTMPGFAVGGQVNGPGTGTSDSILARLSAGEHVVTAAEVQAAGGHAAVSAQRSKWIKGYATGGPVTTGTGGNPTTPTGAPTAAGSAAPASGSLANAVLGSIHQIANPLITAAVAAGKVAVDAVSVAGSGIRAVGENMGAQMGKLATDYITQNDVAPTISGGGNDIAAQAWADSQVGKPYVLGGDFVNGIDCSEYQSGIARAILGQTPAPWFTTFAFNGATAPAGFQEGLQAPYMVGVTNVGVGHMAGTLNGKNYEATPPAVRSGPSARGWDDPMFTMHYGFQPSIQSAVGSLPSNASHLQIIDAAMAAAGVPPPDSKAAWESGLNIIITNESAWDPNAINNYDINAQNGVPSQGLAQVIPPTFNAYHVPGTSTNILDPIANVAAACRYIVAVYGSINSVPGVASVNAGGGYLPYRNGTNNAMRGWHLVGEDGPEVRWFNGGEGVWNASRSKDWLKSHKPSGGGGETTVTVENHWHGNPTQQAVQEATGPMVKKLTQACKAGKRGRPS